MKKILLMGHAAVGKTSMHQVVFAQYPPEHTHRIGYTVADKSHNLRFMGQYMINIWDFGGCDSFMENYLDSMENILKNVSILVYVFEIYEQETLKEKIFYYWQKIVKKVELQNPDILIYVLVNKMDKVPEKEKDNEFRKKKEEILGVIATNKVRVMGIYPTSIFDESLYEAWSQIVKPLIPNRNQIFSVLQSICQSSGCQEALLLEKYSFLILSYFCMDEKKHNIKKHYKMIQILKKRMQILQKYSSVHKIEIESDQFCYLLDSFTPTERIALILKDRQTKIGVSTNLRSMGQVYQFQKKNYFKDI